MLEPDIDITDAPDGDGLLPLKSVRLVIEVLDSTLKTDLGHKAELYADAGVPEYWVVDVNENRVLMHANPHSDGSGYDGHFDVPFGEPLHAATINRLAVETAGLSEVSALSVAMCAGDGSSSSGSRKGAKAQRRPVAVRYSNNAAEF